MDALVILIPLLPFCAALIIGLGVVTSLMSAEDSVHHSADIAVSAIGLSSLMALALGVGDLLGKTGGYFSVGQWLGSGTFDIRINFISAGFNVWLAAVFSLVLWAVARIASHDLPREAGFQRFFFIFCLFAAAMPLFVLSANMIGTLMGCQLAGWCAYLLIGHAYEKPLATSNASYIFIAQQIGSCGFLIGINLCYLWLDSVNWAKLNLAAEQLSIGQATGISLCFAWAAFANSAQLPFTPWLVRAMTAPIPAISIVMSHAGVYLVWLLRPIFEQSPFALAVLGIVGVLTASYSFIVNLAQTNRNYILAYAIAAQLGLMFIECALGWWPLVAWHCGLHVTMRCLQSLNPMMLSQRVATLSNLPVFAAIGKKPWAFNSSLQGFWLQPIIDWVVINPIRKMAQDLYYFDSQIIDHIMGAPLPAIRTLATFAQQDETFIERTGKDMPSELVQGNGLAGKLTQWTATVLHSIEERFVTPGLGKNIAPWMRKVGHAANQFELVIIRPRYLVLFVCITFLVAF